jgi:hypothetical protein
MLPNDQSLIMCNLTFQDMTLNMNRLRKNIVKAFKLNIPGYDPAARKDEEREPGVDVRDLRQAIPVWRFRGKSSGRSSGTKTSQNCTTAESGKKQMTNR